MSFVICKYTIRRKNNLDVFNIILIIRVSLTIKMKFNPFNGSRCFIQGFYCWYSLYVVVILITYQLWLISLSRVFVFNENLYPNWHFIHCHWHRAIAIISKL